MHKAVWTENILICKEIKEGVKKSSVADPDPDPVGSGLFGSPGSGSGSFIHKKTPVI